MRLRGAVERVRRLPCGYACLGLRDLGGGGSGARFMVLVPALVLVRDGFPDVDEVVEVELRRHAGEAPVRLPWEIPWCARQIHSRLGVLGHARCSGPSPPDADSGCREENRTGDEPGARGDGPGMAAVH